MVMPRNEYVRVARVKCTPSVVWAAADEDEGDASGRLGEVLRRLRREDEARKAYEAGIRQAEKYGHGGMADEMKAVRVNLGE
jgi:hypothetical protein